MAVDGGGRGWGWVGGLGCADKTKLVIKPTSTSVTKMSVNNRTIYKSSSSNTEHAI